MEGPPPGQANACPAGGAHDASKSGNYTLNDNVSTTIQQNWQWCHRCGGLFYASYGTGTCPAQGGRGHNCSGRDGYSLGGLGSGTVTQQGSWHWCNKCQGLFYYFVDGFFHCGHPHFWELPRRRRAQLLRERKFFYHRSLGLGRNYRFVATGPSGSVSFVGSGNMASLCRGCLVAVGLGPRVLGRARGHSEQLSDALDVARANGAALRAVQVMKRPAAPRPGLAPDVNGGASPRFTRQEWPRNRSRRSSAWRAGNRPLLLRRLTGMWPGRCRVSSR
jgi:hypothetical protein